MLVITSSWSVFLKISKSSEEDSDILNPLEALTSSDRVLGMESNDQLSQIGPQNGFIGLSLHIDLLSKTLVSLFWNMRQKRKTQRE